MGFIIDCCSNVSFSLLFWVMRRTNSRNPSTKWIRVQVLAQRTFESIVQNGKIHPKTWAPINFCTVLESAEFQAWSIHTWMKDAANPSAMRSPFHMQVVQSIRPLAEWFQHPAVVPTVHIRVWHHMGHLSSDRNLWLAVLKGIRWDYKSPQLCGDDNIYQPQYNGKSQGSLFTLLTWFESQPRHSGILDVDFNFGQYPPEYVHFLKFSYAVWVRDNLCHVIYWFILIHIDSYWFHCLIRFLVRNHCNSLGNLISPLQASAGEVSKTSVFDSCLLLAKGWRFQLGYFERGICQMWTANLAQVLSALNLEANPGDVVALVGESGAGKSASVKLGEMTTCLSLNWNWSHAF